MIIRSRKSYEIKNKKALFIDRDGVLNQSTSSPIRSPEDFHWIPGAIEGLKRLRPLFDYLFIITNQLVVGYGIISYTEVLMVHDHLEGHLQDLGISIDRIYLSTDPRDRYMTKPSPGMIEQAKGDFPDWQVGDSVIIGDQSTDMEAGYRASLSTKILIGGGHIVCRYADFYFDSLEDCSKWYLARANQKTDLCLN